MNLERHAARTAVADGSGPMMLVRRHPVAVFVLLTLAWSWAIWSLLFPLVGRGGLMHNAPPVAFLVALVGGCGPSLAGLLLTGLIDGREGFRALGARLQHVRLGWWWLALTIIPGVSALTPLLRSFAGTEQDTESMLGLLGPGLALGLAAGLMEEIGWRGFLLPRLLERHGPLVSSLCVGLVWGGLWHGFADYFGISGEGAVFWLLMLLLGPGLLTAWSLVLTRLYERTGGSLICSILMHASISSSALIFGQTYATGVEELRWTIVGVALAWVAALLIWWLRVRVPRPFNRGD